ncbi:MAG TPA: hypothetical protein VIV58_22815 [Kofleriaceae bacterium]
MSNTSLCQLSLGDLSTIVGGAAGSAADFNEIRRQAQQYCPQTAARYANVDPAKVTRAQAQQMGSSCVAEISPFLRGVARGRIDDAINQAFPAKR